VPIEDARRGNRRCSRPRRRQLLYSLPGRRSDSHGGGAGRGEWVEPLRSGPLGSTSREINYWLLRVAIDLLKNRLRSGLACYIHTTDYPMHTWPPEAAEVEGATWRGSINCSEKAAAAAPDAAFPADSRSRNELQDRAAGIWRRFCAQARASLFARRISVDRDKYLKHHRGYGGVAWVYCNGSSDNQWGVAKVLTGLEGVELVLPRSEGCRALSSDGRPRIGDLIVLGGY